MKVKLTTTNRAVVAMLAVAALAIAFWMLILGPKREEASKLSETAAGVRASLAEHRSEVASALAARQGFAGNYQQLVVLGKAVPNDSDTASLLVQLERISERAGVRFQEIKLSSSGGSAPAPAPAPSSSGSGSGSESSSASASGSGSESSSGSGSESSSGSTTTASNPAPATEAAASLLPLGATVGPAGLYVMPYSLTFTGDFFHIANFIHGLDSLVNTTNERVSVDGRLLTINAFSLAPGPNGFPSLTASFSVTTYLTPPSQGITAGATPGGPAAATATPASTTLGGTP